MELLNPGFIILCVKIAICVLPGVIGIYLIIISEEKKREIRNRFCSKYLGVSDAIPYPIFERALIVIGILGILFSGLASWILILRGFF